MKIQVENFSSCGEDDLKEQVNKRLGELGDMAVSVQFIYHHNYHAIITKMVGTKI